MKHFRVSRLYFILVLTPLVARCALVYDTLIWRSLILGVTAVLCTVVTEGYYSKAIKEGADAFAARCVYIRISAILLGTIAAAYGVMSCAFLMWLVAFICMPMEVL